MPPRLIFAMTSSFSAYQKQALTCESLSETLSHQLGADIVLLAVVNDEDKLLEILCGYQQSDKQRRGPFVIDLNHLPRLASAIGKGRSLRIAGNSLHPDLDNMGIALGDTKINSALAAIMPKSQQGRIWVALLLRKSGGWEAEDQKELEASLVKIDLLAWQEGNAEEAESADSFIEAPLAVFQELEELEIENQQYRNDIDQLLDYVDHLKGKQKDLDGEIDKSEDEGASSRTSSNGITEADDGAAADQAKEELRLALEEIARLRSKLSEGEAAKRPPDEEKKSNERLSPEKAEELDKVAQKLRQPLSSVKGYSELLLNESVGILGAIQRNFLERIQLSSQKIEHEIEAILQIALTDSYDASLEMQAVNLASVIDDVIEMLREALLEKGSVLRVDLPRLLPSLETDQDAFQQILFHLLQNANSVTPAEKEITLHAAVSAARTLGDYLLIEVSDSGGGIPAEDLARVFARVYRDENPVIAGLGDQGVGLTIAEALTKALGGRIWVDSELGSGTTFSVLLPLERASQVETEAIFA
jgi:signal transduction histidine kinase